MFDPNWQEFVDSPAEIWDIPELNNLFDDEIEMDDESIDNFSFDLNYDY